MSRMPRNAALWNKATRISNGGIHLYIPKEIVERSFKGANIPADSRIIKVRVYGLNSKKNGSARILVKLRVEE